MRQTLQTFAVPVQPQAVRVRRGAAVQVRHLRLRGQEETRPQDAHVETHHFLRPSRSLMRSCILLQYYTVLFSVLFLNTLYIALI